MTVCSSHKVLHTFDRRVVPQLHPSGGSESAKAGEPYGILTPNPADDIVQLLAVYGEWGTRIIPGLTAW